MTQSAQMIGHDKTSAVIERHFGKTKQLHCAQIAIPIALAQTQGALFFAVELGLKFFFAGQAKADQAIPALVLGQAEDFAATRGFLDRFAKQRRQDKAALIARRRISLSTVPSKRHDAASTPFCRSPFDLILDQTQLFRCRPRARTGGLPRKTGRSSKSHVRWKTVITRANGGWKGFLRDFAGKLGNYLNNNDLFKSSLGRFAQKLDQTLRSIA